MKNENRSAAMRGNKNRLGKTKPDAKKMVSLRFAPSVLEALDALVGSPLGATRTAVLESLVLKAARRRAR